MGENKMAGSLGQLNILLGLNSVQFNKRLEQSIVKARNFATETNKSFKSIENSLSILERSAKWTIRSLLVYLTEDSVSANWFF
ncbi:MULTISPECIES: hypothetical protein [Avibacterium]|uniref:hypothetical protein n=1 Tax=Avibacterium TaxID=292486 RepID=UPI0022484F2D|nr:hypothetical protein [Avibacterium sp. 21-594]MCW9716567.1 hypothetical protein [Avibacterium sp. 21-594]